jgi:hypothetical protein
MFIFLIAFAAAFVAVLTGYFLNIYIVVLLVAGLDAWFIRDAKRPNTMPGTSGKMGGVLISLVFLVPFTLVALGTSMWVNYDKIIALLGTIAHWANVLLLR